MLIEIIDWLSSYCVEYYDKNLNDDVRDLLNEVILMIGYFTLFKK